MRIPKSLLVGGYNILPFCLSAFRGTRIASLTSASVHELAFICLSTNHSSTPSLLHPPNKELFEFSNILAL